jgi:hypothetical protein
MGIWKDTGHSRGQGIHCTDVLKESTQELMPKKDDSNYKIHLAVGKF